MSKPQFLTLLRHANAEPWVPGADDFERDLSDLGRRHMAALVNWAAANLSRPEAVLCSPSQRTRSTLAPFGRIWPGLQDITRIVPDIYEATPGTLHALVETALSDDSKVMMVGHNPGFEALAHAVLRNSDLPRAAKMGTGTLAVIEFPGGWARDAGAGVLRHWLGQGDFA